MKTNDIRKTFLDYFRKRGHTVVPSSSLIPQADPTLLFVNAGMVQFKGIFLGEEKRGYQRAASIQKCLRAGGKHNDLENVGRTSRHHTFFEMLGNFSFGDYFKNDAIEMAWEFLTTVLCLPKERLWVTVFRDDDEAARIWEEGIGIERARVIRMGEEDNFWAMGEVGPCGPCSEIVIDQGEEVGCGSPDCKVGCSCDRYLELWNLVFMQFNRDPSGNLLPLPRPSIDTGMGLERLASIMQGVRGDYEIDLFKRIIGRIEDISGRGYHKDPEDDFSMRVIADHSRAIAFLLAEGILPSNEGRGYILRRIIRRAARHGRRLGIRLPFLTRVCEGVVESMSDIYPELLKMSGFMEKAIYGEEERFFETLDRGLALLDEMIRGLKEEDKREIPGSYAFKLYDTYGFPIDITMDIAMEEGFRVDRQGFEREMERQKEMARRSWKASLGSETLDLLNRLSDKGIKTEFVGYSKNTCISKIVALIKENRFVEEAKEGDEVGIIVEKTPFYGEAGGQVGDKGIIVQDASGRGQEIKGKVVVMDTKKPTLETIIHYGIIKKGALKVGDVVRLALDTDLRKATSLNHTATHLLHSVLRKTLGTHVRQTGSFVAPDRLRFDFTHFSGLTEDEILKIEEEVNCLIREDMRVSTRFLPIEDAVAEGAIALFDEKYGERVRLVEIGNVSKELCGGTHAKRTGEIGLFRITNESAVAAGIRRLEALTGKEAYREVIQDKYIVKDIAQILKSNKAEIKDRLNKLLHKQRDVEKEVILLRDRLKTVAIDTLLQRVKEVDGIKILSTVVEAKGSEELKDWADKIKERIGSGIVVLGAKEKDRAHILVVVTKDLTSRFNASEIVNRLAKGIDGKGGGRADMAQAGGKNPSRLKEVLEEVYKIIASWDNDNFRG